MSKTEKWNWMMYYCKVNRMAPADTDSWNDAEEAWEESLDLGDLEGALDIRSYFNKMDTNKFLDMLEKHIDFKIDEGLRSDWGYFGLNNHDAIDIFKEAKEKGWKTLVNSDIPDPPSK